MKKRFKGLRLYAEEVTLENGLTVYLIPMKEKKGVYATLTTKFGSYVREVKVDGKKYKLKDGIAHFLEHKMFETKDEKDVLSIFSSLGVSCNAMTSLYKTTYLFDGNSEFKKALGLLLDYVFDPYFTDSNVEKEKHIIEQEIDMYADNPYRKSYEKLMENIYLYDSARVSTIGSKKSVRSITKEDLYFCFDNFYHPSNMFLVISGGFDVEKALSVIKKHQRKREKKEVEIISKKEPLKVKKEYEEIKMNITIPKLTLGYKISLEEISKKTGMEIQKIRRYINLYTTLKFGGVSNFLEEIRTKEVASDIEYGTSSTDDILVLIIEAETKKEKEFISLLERELKVKTIDSYLFELKKKALIASSIYATENIYGINKKVMLDVVDYGKVEYDTIDKFKKLNYEEFLKVVEQLDFTLHSYVIVNPLDNDKKK